MKLFFQDLKVTVLCNWAPLRFYIFIRGSFSCMFCI